MLSQPHFLELVQRKEVTGWDSLELEFHAYMADISTGNWK